MIRILVWNVEWARARTPRGHELRRQMAEVDPDIICMTEGFAELLPDSGHVIDADPDYGYRLHEGRRKVLLWSSTPWESVDRLGSPDLPGGRFVRGLTNTSLGPLDVFGVCIPWQGAHVSTGRKDRRSWEDHSRYLGGLRSMLSGREDGMPAVVAGDFNQTVPRTRTPTRLYDELMRTFEADFTICTAGELDGLDTPAIDHVAHTASLTCTHRRALPKVTADGLRLSDHDGILVELSQTYVQEVGP